MKIISKVVVLTALEPMYLYLYGITSQELRLKPTAYTFTVDDIPRVIAILVF